MQAVCEQKSCNFRSSNLT